MTAAGDERPDERPDARLYERVRAYAADWVAAEQDDPGIAMAELFAFLADALAAYQDQIGHEADLRWSRYLSVHLQEGRVVIDSDWHEAVDGKVYGVYRGVVVDDDDPRSLGRLLVEVPTVLAGGPRWALPSLPAGSAGSTALPPVGSVVWVAFEEGDVDRPVWLGRVPTAPSP